MSSSLQSWQELILETYIWQFEFKIMEMCGRVQLGRLAQDQMTPARSFLMFVPFLTKKAT
jgi:hypothetical protein